MTSKTPLDAGFVARAAAGIRSLMDGWFGAGSPPDTVAPESAKGRRYDYPVYINTQSNKPRHNEGIDYRQLRALADNYDLLRIIIERRKDQLAKLSWTIQKRDLAATNRRENTTKDSRIDAAIAFFRLPDKEHTWDTWLRMLLEDLLVIDAACLYPRKTRGGGLYALEPVDGSTIKRLLDNTGRTPMPPEPAYQQILHGMAATEYTREELIYRPRNVRTHKVYGCSPVEQIIATVNIALRRQMHQLEYYQSGSVPDALIGVPDTWQPDDIERFQAYWDLLVSGSLNERRKLRFLPGELARNFVETKQPPLKDQYDEWLARVVCFCFSIEPTPFVAQVNRATAETSREQSLAEGLAPLQSWVKSIIDDVLARFMDAPDLEFVWDEEEAVDPKTQAEINCQYVAAGILTADEVRADMGREPLPEAPEAENDEDGFGQPDNATDDVAKAAKPYRPINRERPQVAAVRAEAEDLIAAFLQEQAAAIAEQITGSLNTLAKAEGDKDAAIVDSLSFSGWVKLARQLFGLLKRAYREGGLAALLSIGVAPKGKMRQIRSLATAWANHRAAEMVGMRWVGGVLIQNPDAKWQITETTRQMLRGLVENALADGWSADTLKAEIMQHNAFSRSRAAMIARTEIANADMAGTMQGWQQSGLVIGKRWVTVGDDKVSADCVACEQAGAIALDALFPSGRPHPTNHPHCRCDLLPVLVGEEEELEKGYNPNQPRDKNGRWSSSWGLGSISDGAHADVQRKDTHTLGNVSQKNSQAVSKTVGTDLSGFAREVHDDELRHTFRSHGNPAKEAARGQRAITNDDFARLPAIVNKPDKVILTPKAWQNMDTLEYHKQFETERYVYIEAVRTKKKKVKFVSLRIHAKKP